MSVVDYQSALEFLLGRVNYETFKQMPYAEMRQNLDRLKNFLAFLGRPELRFPIIHVAGTKGKGSTCAMIDAIFRSAGYRVGRFTSPHLHSLNERFAVNNQPCPNERLVEVVQYLESQWHAWQNDTTQRELTFFEWSLLLAFEYFAREKVDLVVLETGIGGRFDATSICEPTLCVITSISFEHTEQLGNTLAAIAGEKAGIIKSNIPIISGVEPYTGDNPQAVIREVAEKNHAPLYEKNRDFSVTLHHDGTFDFHWQNGDNLPQLQLALLGRHQRENAALAIASAVLLRQHGFNIVNDAIRTALAKIAIPGRVERLSRLQEEPIVIVDGAHNKASAEALLEALQSCNATISGRKILLFGSTIGKDIPGMFETLFPFFDEIWLSQYTSSPRACPTEELLEFAKNTTIAASKIIVCNSLPDAITQLRHLPATNLLCATGSMYFAAEFRQLWSIF